MASIFSSIIDGNIPAAFVHDDPSSVAFLSINPITTGHTLVVPKLEVNHWLDCPSDLRDHLMAVAARIGRAIELEWKPARVGLMIAGLEVPHLHIHVLPIWSPNDMDFANAAPTIQLDDLNETALRIRNHLGESIGGE